MMKRIILSICIAAFATALSAQNLPQKLYSFHFKDSQLDVVLDRLQEFTGKDITVDLGVTATVTLNVSEKVTADEASTILILALQEEGLRIEDLDEDTLRVRGISNPKPAASGHGEDTLKQQEKWGAKESQRAYAERRRQRMQNRHKPADASTSTAEELEKHMQAYQMEVIREGLTPLPVPLTPEEIEKLNREGMTLPADAIAEETPALSDINE